MPPRQCSPTTIRKPRQIARIEHRLFFTAPHGSTVGSSTQCRNQIESGLISPDLGASAGDGLPNQVGQSVGWDGMGGVGPIHRNSGRQVQSFFRAFEIKSRQYESVFSNNVSAFILVPSFMETSTTKTVYPPVRLRTKGLVNGRVRERVRPLPTVFLSVVLDTLECSGLSILKCLEPFARSLQIPSSEQSSISCFWKLPKLLASTEVVVNPAANTQSEMCQAVSAQFIA